MMMPRHCIRCFAAGSLAVAALLPGQAASAQEVSLPFRPGEELIFRSKLGRLSGSGKGVMRVEVDTIRSVEAYLLSFDFETKVGPLRVEARSRSWLDPERMAALRFHKHERHPLASKSEDVELYPAERKWQSAEGREGCSTTDAPLDELSFLYYIRTLDLRDGAEYVIERHFDPARNPVHVQVLGRERATVPAGVFDVVVVEMRVRDRDHFDGDGSFRLYLTDDARRYPVRLETSASIAGTAVLELEAAIPARSAPAARVANGR
ncbi:MAG TPA: DUF3108 domain-containing protein [Longimicrobiales bacterium]